MADKAVQRRDQKSIREEASPLSHRPGVSSQVTSPGFGIEFPSGALEEVDEEVLDPLDVNPQPGKIPEDRSFRNIAPDPPASLRRVVAQSVLGEPSQRQIPLMHVGKTQEDLLHPAVGPSVETDELAK